MTDVYELWRITDARHASAAGRSFGWRRPGMEPGQFEQLLESHNEARLGIESGQPDRLVNRWPIDTSDEKRFDYLAMLTGWGETWAQQSERLQKQDEDADMKKLGFWWITNG